ncbi:SDR family oxidoreductase [Streptomyces canus]|uniref:SDR family oxidoreductase n=1 Tax=Streptomyces canus TaxID=58343 RepID=UPI003CF08EF6
MDQDRRPDHRPHLPLLRQDLRTGTLARRPTPGRRGTLHGPVAVAPGAVGPAQRAHPLRRAAGPEEVAEAAVRLLGDRASCITGVVLSRDGGIQVS